MFSSLLLFMVLLLLLNSSQKGVNSVAPRGCNFKDGSADCDFQRWKPPLQDDDFGPEPLKDLMLYNIDGTIPGGAFSGLNGPSTKNDTIDETMKLVCDSSGDTSLSRDVFTQNLHWVIRLEIVDCRLPSRSLENLKGLAFLKIDSNSAVLVVHDSLAGLTNLEGIDYACLFCVGQLPPGLFDGLTNLTQIYLNAGLNSVSQNRFEGLVSLKEIDLSENYLQTLQAGLFHGLVSLEEIDLSKNYLQTLPAELFHGLVSLQEIDLSENYLQTLPAGIFDGLRSIEEIDFFENYLQTLPGGLFDGLVSLKEIDLSKKYFQTLPAELFNGLSSIEEIDLSENYLQTLPAELFDGLVSLKEIELSENYLQNLPIGLFDGLVNLTSINLFDNNLQTLQAGLFDWLRSLEEIYLSDNNLQTLPVGLFDGLVSLQKIDLLENYLQTLPAGLFDGLEGLEELDLSENYLQILPAGLFDGLVSLKVIDLSENNLQTLQAGLFDELTSVTTFEFSNNPWNCSCGLKWLLDYVADLTPFEKGGKNETGSVASLKVYLCTSKNKYCNVQKSCCSVQNGIYRILKSACVYDDYCQYPSEFQNRTLEDVLRELDCQSSTSTIPSTAVSSVVQFTEITTSSVFTVAGRLTSKTTAVATRIVWIAVIGGLTVLYVVAAIIYRCLCWNVRFGRPNRVNSAQQRSP